MRKFLFYCIFALLLFIALLIESSLLGTKLPIIEALIISIIIASITALTNLATTVAMQKQREKQMSKSHINDKGV